MSLLDEDTFTLTRPSAGRFVDGSWTQDGDPTTSTHRGSVQPTPGRQAQYLPEAVRNRENISIFTRSELRAASETAKTKGDRIVFGGATYEVHTVRAWRQGGAAHYEATAARVDEAERRGHGNSA